MSLRHPGRVALRQWLAGDADDDVERHVDTCSRCANVLVQLDAPDAEAGEALADAALAEALAQALAPPDDLTERLVAGVNERLSAREVMGVVADLFGAGIETTRLLFIEDTNDDS